MDQESKWQEEEQEPRIGFIVGTIVDESKKPLEGVRITTNDSATYSDAKGTFVIGDRPCLNPHQLMVYLEGFAIQMLKIELAAGYRQQVALTMSTIDGVVRGVVRDMAGNPIQGVKVCLASPNGPCTDTFADGGYVLSDLCGSWAITGTKDPPYKTYYGTATIPGTKNFRMRK
jgi:hypothetical protein